MLFDLDVPNMSYTFPDIRHYIMTYDITCLTGDAPDVLLRLLNINNHVSSSDICTTYNFTDFIAVVDGAISLGN